MPSRIVTIWLLGLAFGGGVAGIVALVSRGTAPGTAPTVSTQVDIAYPEPVPSGVGSPGGRRPHPDGGPGWVVLDRLTAHAVMIVQVETNRLDESRSIAAILVAPVRDRYAEVLVYFLRPGQSSAMPVKRVQWTPNGGYVETLYSDP